MQLRPPSGHSFWDLSHVRWSDFKCGSPAYYDKHWWVEWEGRQWLRKVDEDALREVAGYQVAQMLDLPVQPWVAFFQHNEPGRDGFPCCNGILVERWPVKHFGGGGLSEPRRKRPDWVARLLVMLAFSLDGDPEWLATADERDYRLIDLELFGPKFSWPIEQERIKVYGKEAECLYRSAQDRASREGLEAEFEAGIGFLLLQDLKQVLDFSGHPSATVLKEAFVRGLTQWQRELFRIRRAGEAA